MTKNKEFIGFGLHDAVLESITIDWIKASATVDLVAVTPVRERVIICATDIVELVCLRRQPWGTGDHTLYVNDVKLADANGGRRRLALEMCSGDTLTITAENITRTAGSDEK